MVYDILEHIDAWEPTGEGYFKDNPNRLFWQIWKPKILEMEVLEKTLDGERYRVGYYNDGAQIIAEYLEVK